MDTTTLVSDLINDGQRILDRLVREGFDVTAAFWVRRYDEERWSFYIVSPSAESGRLRDAYSRVHTIIRRLPEPHWIDPLTVELIGPGHRMARDVLAIHDQSSSSKASPIRWSGNRLGNVDVEGAYLYPLPVAAS